MSLNVDLTEYPLDFKLIGKLGYVISCSGDPMRKCALFLLALLTTAAANSQTTSATQPANVLAALISGLGLASMFALLLSLMSRYAENAPVHNSPLALLPMKYGGGALLFGVTSSAFGSLRFGFVIPALETVMLMFFVAREDRLNRISRP